MKKPEVITKYQRLKDYTLWYYFRYYPSIWKMKFKLMQKTLKNEEMIEQLFQDIWHLFDDKPVIESKIQSYLFRNKNKNYIISQLISKQFKREEVLTLLEKFTTEWKSVLSEDFIYKKILQLKNKNKSKNYIKYKLIEQPEDKQKVENILSEIYSDQWEENEISAEIDKLKYKNLEQAKLIQKLLQKWFQYWDIIKNINNMN